MMQVNSFYCCVYAEESDMNNSQSEGVKEFRAKQKISSFLLTHVE
jgi:hypothetical protein